MSYLSPEEYELYRLARTLGGASKAKELLKTMHDKDISVDSLLAYLKSIEYKVPSPLEGRIEDLERRISILEGKPTPRPTLPPPRVEEEVTERAKIGERLQQAEYTLPILEALIEMGGKGRMRNVLDRVFDKIRNQVKPKDLEQLPSGTAIRWKNTAQWERQRLKGEGYLEKESPRGIWEITDEGRKLYERLKQRKS